MAAECYWDDISNKELVPALVREARAEEMEEFKKHQVYREVPISKAWASTGKKGTDPDKLFAVGPGSAEFQSIAAEFTKTLPQLKIGAIERVENGYQHEMFTVFAKGVEQVVGAQYDARTMRRLLSTAPTPSTSSSTPRRRGSCRY